jgi:tetratricopeptide (TPR) repeat protein
LVALTLPLLALLAATPTPDRAHSEVLPFAYALMADGDYYRAIGELERFAFLAPEAPETFPALLTIGRAYELGGKPEDAARWLGRLEPVATTLQLRGELQVEQGYARYLAGDAPRAIATLSDAVHGPLHFSLARDTFARAQYLLAWALLFHGESGSAAAAFDDVPLPVAPDLASAARGYDQLPRKSPLLAGALSALLPGLGHLYLGLPGIGLAALAWNALFVFATWDALHHHLWGVGASLGFLEGLWYGGAIFGAVSGAEKYNRDAQLNYLDALRTRYDVAPMAWPPSAVHPRD